MCSVIYRAKRSTASSRARPTTEKACALRDYGTGRWEGGDPSCDHKPPQAWVGDAGDLPYGGPNGLRANEAKAERRRGGVCHCGARRVDDQIGSEPTINEYVARLVDVFAELRRVLKPTGTVWLNLGDSFASKQNSGTGWDSSTLTRPEGRPRKIQTAQEASKHTNRNRFDLPQKNLLLIPARVAMALQESGWIVRQCVIWSKPNQLPESVRDRPATAHEYVFMLTKARWTGAIEPVSMSREEAAWLAAIVDGEGSICFSERANREWAPTISPRLSIVNTNKQLLERVAQITRLAVNHAPSPRRRRDGSEGRPIWTWQITDRKAAKIIQAIRPFLIAKGAQADLALAVYALNAKMKGGGSVGRTTDADLAYKRRAAAACSDLNHGRDVDLSWFRPRSLGRWEPQQAFYDAAAVKEPAKWERWGKQTSSKHARNGDDRVNGTHIQELTRPDLVEKFGHKRHLRSVWEIPTTPNGLAVCEDCESFFTNSADADTHRDRTGHELTQHYAAFPRKLVEKCLTAGCPPGGLVCDPFLGSGTTALVTRATGRRCVGVELRPAFARMTAWRLSQLSLLAEANV